MLPQLLDPEVEVDPYAFYRRLRTEAPVWYDESAGAYLVTRHADVSALYRHPSATTQNYSWQLEPVMGVTLLQLEGLEHSRVRGLLTPYFRGDGLAKWLPLIEANIASILDATVKDSVASLADSLTPGQEIDLVSDFARYLPVYVIADMLGLPKDDHSRFYGWYSAQSAFLSNLAGDPEVEARGRAALAELREYLRPLVAARRTGDGADLVSVLSQAHVDDDQLLDEEVMSHVIHLLNAGSETTERTIVNLFRHLLTERSRFEKVRDDRRWVTAAVSETLRLTPPSQLNGRLVVDDIELETAHLPAGSFVLLVMASANRDERRFAKPDSFWMERPDLAHDRAFTSVGEHFAFGYGRHFCLGAQVARTELEATVNVLLDRFPHMHLASGFTPVDRGIKMRSPTELRVAL